MTIPEVKTIPIAEKPVHASELPGFEGSEKRLELDFYPSRCATYSRGLRHLDRSQLDELMTLAQCEIVSYRTCETFDAYVLSESSLFVYAHKLVLKTCGTTKLLGCAERLLEFCAPLKMGLRRCKYTRASYKYPEVQPAPHQSFEQEIDYLDDRFSKVLGSKGAAHVLGNSQDGLQWHIYIADAEPHGSTVVHNARQTLEICMTGLSQDSVAPFWHMKNGGDAVGATEASGIRDLLAESEIDDFVFEPCGYSMNGLEGDAFNTIHITPEEGFSYASLELSGYKNLDVNQMVSKCAKVFNPKHLVVAVSTDAADNAGEEELPSLDELPAPNGMSSDGCTYQLLGPGGALMYCTFSYKVQPSGPIKSKIVASVSEQAFACLTPTLSESSYVRPTMSIQSINSMSTSTLCSVDNTPSTKKPRVAESLNDIQSQLVSKLESIHSGQTRDEPVEA